MINAPSGLVTFLFTDIEGSTKIAQQYPGQMQGVLAEHDNIIRSAVESNNGIVFLHVGDGYCCAFADAADALHAAAHIQQSAQGRDPDGVPLKIRIGIHTGNAEWSGERYMGYMTLARTSRIMSAAHGEQTLVSDETAKHSFDRITGNISLRDLGERRLKDLIQSLRLYELIVPGLRTDFPPIKALDLRPNNLPVQITGFIGREDEINSLKTVLSRTRLLTILGAGGAGKTRLSIQLAAEVMDDFPDGVWLVELAQIAEAGLLAQAVMQSLDLAESPDTSPKENLAGNLKDKRLLIILDNCEHIVDEVAELTEFLLMKSRQAKILATSREALRCEGEQTFLVLPLKFPDPADNVSPEMLIRYESVRLFIERALSVNRNFRVNDKNASALANICFQLDGIPLAIELAAAKIGVLSLEQINLRLDNRFQLLKGGRRTSLPRQQTLRAMIDWSYELMDLTGKKFWNRLSIFLNGCTIESAEAVCCADESECGVVIDHLTHLTDKSVVFVDDESQRFRMLETIRQYGEDKLKESGSYAETSRRHAEYFRDFVSSAEKEIRGEKGKEWIKAIEYENANIEKALKWSIDNGNTVVANRIASSMGTYWQLRGLISEAAFWLSQTIKLEDKIPTPDLCKVLSHAGNFARIQGEYQKAGELLRESLEMSRQIGDINSASDTLNRLGIFEYDLGNFEESIRYYEQNLFLYRERGDKLGTARSLNNIGNAYCNMGDTAKGQELYEECLLLRREMGDRLGVAITLNNMGILLYEKGNYERALSVLEESLEIRTESGDKTGIAITLANLGHTYYNQGYYEEATEHYDKYKEILTKTGERFGIAESIYNFAKVSIARNEIAEAEELMNKLHVLTDELNTESITVLTHYAAGRLAFMKGDLDEADRFYKSSIQLYAKMGNYKDVDINLIRLAELLCKRLCFSEAATIMGYVKKEYFENKGVKLPLTEQQAYDSTLSLLKNQTDHTEMEKRFSTGALMTADEVIKYSLSSGIVS